MKENQKKSSSFLHLFEALFKNDDGFSLAEVMVAAGMIGVLSLGVSQLMQNSAKTEKRLGQQINLVSLEAGVREALNNQVACNRTLRAQQMNPDPDNDPTTDNTPFSFALDGNWQDLPGNAIYRGNNPQNLSDQLATWGVELVPYVNGDDQGIYGSGSNTVTVRSINVRGFFDETESAYGDDANYNLNNKDLVTGSAPPNHIGRAVIRIEFTRGNYSQFENMGDDAQRQRESAKRTYGTFLVTRFFPVRVRVNNANQIIRCVTTNDDVISSFCSSLGGYLDEDGLCKNLKISELEQSKAVAQGNAPEQDHNWALSLQKNTDANLANSQGGNLLAEHSIAIGWDDDNGLINPANIPEGDLLVRNDTSVGRALNVGTPATVAATQGDGAFQRDVQVDRALNVGAPGTRATVAGDATAARDVRAERNLFAGNNGNITNVLTVGENTAGTLGRLIVNGDENLFRDPNGDTSNLVRMFNGGRPLVVQGNTAEAAFLRNNNNLRVNPSDGLSMQIEDGGSRTLRVLDEGRIQIYNPSDANQVVIDIAAGGTSYRPIRVWNQNVGTGTMTFPDTADNAAGAELATKRWVRKMVFGSLASDPTLIADVVGNIAKYAQHKPLEVIKEQACESIRLQTGGGGSQNYSTCTYNTGTQQCNCNESNCSNSEGDPVGSAVCRAITSTDYIIATTFMRARRFYVNGTADPGNGNIRAVNIYANTDMVANRDVRAIRNVRANNSILAGVNVQAGNSVVATNRVCAQGNGGLKYCYTRFGKWSCSNYGFMIGIAYGQPICGRNGGGASSAIFH